uniref:TRAF-type domain-containing protein n=2 Tax=Pygocentrus nattereri TaxID=42514 RepID=A0AAR2K0C5_PYGNA
MTTTFFNKTEERKAALLSTSGAMDEAVDTTEELELCSHCNKEVAKVNFSMHEAHCKRFLCLCPDCDDSVPKEQLEEHRKEQHTVVRCQKCNKKMQRCKLPDHEKDECSERPQSCEFCNLELPLSALNEHTETCGSRTERCLDCKQYVMLRDQTRHAQICSPALSEDHSSNNDDSINENMKCAPTDNLQDDQKLGAYLSYDQCDLYGDLRQDLVSEEPEELPDLKFSFLTQQKKEIGAVGFGDWDQISTCPHCHLALPLRTLEWHEKKCKIFESLKLIT